MMLQPKLSERQRRFFGLILCLTAIMAHPALAAKTDILVLKNGDRITGEVKKLEAACDMWCSAKWIGSFSRSSRDARRSSG